MGLSHELEFSLRLGLAALFGAFVGLERERHDRPAGLRTFILVSVGACLFGIVSDVGFPSGDTDHSRIASQVVTGVGFLGAGAVFRGESGVRGLTTAAGIWAMAAIGLALGGGLYFLATTGTAIALFTLAIVRRWERLFFPPNPTPRSGSESSGGHRKHRKRPRKRPPSDG